MSFDRWEAAQPFELLINPSAHTWPLSPSLWAHRRLVHCIFSSKAHHLPSVVVNGSPCLLGGGAEMGKFFNCCTLFLLCLCWREEVSMDVKENVRLRAYVQLCLYGVDIRRFE